MKAMNVHRSAFAKVVGTSMVLLILTVATALADSTFKDLELALEGGHERALRHGPRVVTVALRNPTRDVVKETARLSTFEDLQLVLEIEHERAHQHGPRVVIVTLRNPTRGVVKGNTRLSTNYHHLRLHLTSPDGHEQEARTGRSDMPPRCGPGPLPVDIHPGTEISRRILLRGGDQIVEPGTYGIRAEFEDWDRSGIIKAEPITFEVLPLPEDESMTAAFLTKHDVFEVLSFEAGAINSSRLEGMKTFVAKNEFQQSIFMPYVKARLGYSLMRRYYASLPPTKERRDRGAHS